MAIASSSRRKHAVRRQVSSDIEEDETNRTREQDQVFDDEVVSQPRGKKRVKEEKKGKGKQVAQEEPTHSEEDGNDSEEVIDVNDFHNQPLHKGDLVKLKGFSSDWEHMGAKIRQSWSVVGEVGAALADSAEGKDAEKGISELDAIMRNLIDVDAEMTTHGKVMDEIYQKVAQGVAVDDVVTQYLNGIKAKKTEYNKKTTRQKYAKSDGYFKFRQAIYEVEHPETPMPPITDFLEKEDGDDSDDDDDLEVGGVTQNYYCPITLTPLVNPLTSSVCGHSFSAEAIRQTFRGSAAKKCPASGCNKSFTLADCKPDKELAKKVKAWQRRTQRAEADSDAEEVIDD